jgi:hypothetical protein
MSTDMGNNFGSLEDPAHREDVMARWRAEAATPRPPFPPAPEQAFPPIPEPAETHHHRRWLAVVVLVLVLAAGAFTAFQLTKASSPMTAAQLSKAVGCTRSPGVGDQTHGQPGVQGFYCVGDILDVPTDFVLYGEADFALLQLFSSPGAATAFQNHWQSATDAMVAREIAADNEPLLIHYVYTDQWAVWGTDSAVIAAAINAGGTQWG